MQDNRKIRRNKVLRAALIMHGSSSINCVIRNETKAGAGLRLGGISFLPESFQLKVQGSSLVSSCVLSWHRGCDLGVRFIDTCQA